MNSADFEKLVQELLLRKLEKEFGYTVPVHHQKEYIALTNNKYKIDVSYSFTLLNVEYLTLVECKYWNSHVTREKVGYFKSIIDDLKAHKGIVITTKGFQSGAIEYARSQRIGLVKITNDRYFEMYTHADGGIEKIDQMLLQDENINWEAAYTAIGLFSPAETPTGFIAKNYGLELANYLQNFDPGVLDDNLEFDPVVKKQLLKMPDKWSEDYTRSETGGLRYKLLNEHELRLLNTAIFMLKFGI